MADEGKAGVEISRINLQYDEENGEEETLYNR